MNANGVETTQAGPEIPGLDNPSQQLRHEFAGRLVKLSTGQAGLRGMLEVKACQPAAAAGEPSGANGAARAPIIDFIASDATLDRGGEVIEAAGWRLDNFRRNPVFQNAHNYGNIIFTLGRAQIAEVRGGRLFLRVLFAADINPMARLAYDLYRRGFLNAVSVGFLPRRWENGTERTPWRRRFLEQELLEVSAVAVPANPNALALALKTGAVTPITLLQAARALAAEFNRTNGTDGRSCSLP
jgi:HK97 family phage prohead protease